MVEDILKHIRDFIREEIKEARQKLLVSFGSSSMSLSVDNVPEDMRFDYLSYLVCDLLIISQDVNMLMDQ